MSNKYIATLLLLMCTLTSVAEQRFYNLTASEVRIGSVVPVFTCSLPLEGSYSDSLYTVSILYPEFIDMSDADVAEYERIGGAALPELPVVHSTVVVERKRGALEVIFVPLVERDGKKQKLVSFMLDVQAAPKHSSARRVRAVASTSTDRYVANSVLASGSWAKIRVPETGVYQLTEALIKQAGFTDLSRVHVYGYGGNLQPEKLEADYLSSTDDLQEVPICLAGGKRLFHALGPVNWESKDAATRTRNPYSDYGYYFITQTDSVVATVDSATFVADFYPAYDDYHALHEIDNYAWYEGGRNLYEKTAIESGSSLDYTIATSGYDGEADLTVCVSAGVTSVVQISANDSVLGTATISVSGSYAHGASITRTYHIYNATASNTVNVSVTSGGPVRLDYISTAFDTPYRLKSFTDGSFDAPEYVYNITNQNHHADEQADMIIIIPTSQELLTQAERLKAFHEEHDGMVVNIVPADELYNEYSSGTPDVNAYRRYLKMLYDRADDDEDAMPSYLLLFGDCAWDNRMNSTAWKSYSVDDFLLCYESENSFSATDCYVNDGYFCSLDDGEGANPTSSDKHDIAVGRFPVRSAAEAKIMVDKTINYIENENAGDWQNVVMFMGDDGNNNLHMDDAEEAAELVESLDPGFVVKRVMWDAYTEVATSTGNTYPEASTIIKEQQAAGALIMDYSGHGAQTQISHEGVLRLSDFKSFTNTNLPLWITASCDIAPFDSQTENIGEQAVLNANGGAVAFYGTTRTVYTDRNKRINKAFLRALLTPQNGAYVSLGEAQRIAKNSLIEGGTDGYDRTVNKLQYALLGDPALVLNIPTLDVVIDSINGTAVGSADTIRLKALSVATVKGHIERNGQAASDFSGVLSATVRDSKELITCKMNASAEATSAFTYYDRTKTLYAGTDSVMNGDFSFTFAVTKDINYSDEEGMINVYAVNGSKDELANGCSTDFIVGGTADNDNDSIGPSIYCYLNTPSFTNGDNVNATPYFVAQISDEDGINTTGAGIGHDLELIIDGEMSKTYILNDYFSYDFGSFTSGTVAYSIPTLEEGAHTLKFRAWDVNNNSSTATLSFNVVEGLEPQFFSVAVSENPASESTTFIINHDRAGSELDVEIDVFDISGRQLWNYSESGVASSNTYTVDWDLTVDNGVRLQTGVYVYRVRISSDGSSRVSKAQKLIILQ